MEQRLTMIGLGVSDLSVSADFYENKFGWTKTKSSNDDIIFYQLNGMLLSLYPKEKLAADATVEPDGEGFRGFTLAYNCRSKAEVDDVFADLKQKGVQTIKPAEEVFWGGYSGYIADPDGNLWEIAFNPFFELDVAGNTNEK